jgi:electron transfer flavoprotein alpha subunit
LDIYDQRCIGCGKCVRHCPYGALSMKGTKAQVSEACAFCGACVESCPVEAIHLHQPHRALPKPAECRGVWIFGEQKEGVIQPVVYELIGKGRELADAAGEPLTVVVLGEGLDEAVDALKPYPVDTILQVEASALGIYAAEPYSRVFADLIEERTPSVVLAGATAIGRSFLARVAVYAETGLTADCTALAIQGGALEQIRPAFGGNIMAAIATPNHRPQMATVRHKVFAPAVRRGAGEAGVERIEVVDPKALLCRTRRGALNRSLENVVNLAEADMIVAGGRGLGRPEGFSLLASLAEVLGAGLAASRSAVDNGWIPYSHQVGQTGTTVAPKVYFAIGISGAIQHQVGMRSADCVVAINKDPAAPIFEVADYRIVGDLYEVVPALIEECRAGVC